MSRFTRTIYHHSLTFIPSSSITTSTFLAIPQHGHSICSTTGTTITSINIANTNITTNIVPRNTHSFPTMTTTPKSQQPTPSPQTTSSKSSPLHLTGVNLPITTSIRSYITEKLTQRVLKKYDHLISHTDVRLTIERNPSISLKHHAEVVIFLKTGNHMVIRGLVKSKDMYMSIDKVCEKIGRKLRKFKERLIDRHQMKKNLNKDDIFTSGEEEVLEIGKKRVVKQGESDKGIGDEVVDDDDEMFEKEWVEEDKKNHVIVKKKVFPMPKQTVEEAILCLDYIDHDFYLFRNEQSGEINLVYKRNHGGIGLITPEDPNAKED